MFTEREKKEKGNLGQKDQSDKSRVLKTSPTLLVQPADVRRIQYVSLVINSVLPYGSATVHLCLTRHWHDNYCFVIILFFFLPHCLEAPSSKQKIQLQPIISILFHLPDMLFLVGCLHCSLHGNNKICAYIPKAHHKDKNNSLHCIFPAFSVTLKHKEPVFVIFRSGIKKN